MVECIILYPIGARPRTIVIYAWLKMQICTGVKNRRVLNMKQKSGALAFILSAVILWALSLLPFMNITFGGTTWVTILIVALVLGVINFFLVSFVRGLFKKGGPLFMFVICLVIDAAALWLAGVILSNFSIEFFPTAIIAAAVLAAVCSATGLVKD